MSIRSRGLLNSTFKSRPRALVLVAAAAVSLSAAMQPGAAQHARVLVTPAQGSVPSPILSGQVEASWLWEPLSPSVPPPDTRAPELVESVMPEHTHEATRAGVEGHVIIEATIDAHGVVVEPRIIRRLPSDELNSGSLEAVRAWRFRSATRDGQPVPVTGIFTFSFTVTAEEPLSDLRRNAAQLGTEGLVAPRQLTTELPEYTDEAKAQRIEGDVYIEAVVRKDGTVAEPKLIRGLPDEELNRRALEAVRHWTFEPGMKDEEPIDVIALFTITYRIH